MDNKILKSIIIIAVFATAIRAVVYFKQGDDFMGWFLTGVLCFILVCQIIGLNLTPRK